MQPAHGSFSFPCYFLQLVTRNLFLSHSQLFAFAVTNLIDWCFMSNLNITSGYAALKWTVGLTEALMVQSVSYCLWAHIHLTVWSNSSTFMCILPSCLIECLNQHLRVPSALVDNKIGRLLKAGILHLGNENGPENITSFIPTHHVTTAFMPFDKSSRS